MTRGLYPLIADAIVGHGDRNRDVKGVHPTISDTDLALEVDRIKFDQGTLRYGSRNGPGTGATGRRSSLEAPESRVNKNRKPAISQLACDFSRLSGGSDEIRTRDLRRDRPKTPPELTKFLVVRFSGPATTSVLKPDIWLWSRGLKTGDFSENSSGRIFLRCAAPSSQRSIAC
jgi:hypothetical protein